MKYLRLPSEVVSFNAASVGEEQLETTPHNWSTRSYHPLPAFCNYNILGWDCPLSFSHSAFSLTPESL